MKLAFLTMALVLSTSAFAKDVICYNNDLSFGLKFDRSLSEVMAIESDVETLMNSGIETVNRGSYKHISSYQEEVGSAEIILMEVIGTPNHRRYKAKAQIEIPNKLDTKGLQDFDCYTTR